ncbi:YtxH domain-containing protein [Desertibacillus haloalkaliphilus]|uniref:YtxH domain-containing protein n=1 Tax=Desertibacillus haloalkaliphilus TaxID=1328930 RepID=UPI001C261929|nr:YtxH domain-containing protein [Desertibacillus haloalkaliphilus]MBU8907990.1 YtxH domain-containing protein [Desertibacillus haloalkaliphilus]
MAEQEKNNMDTKDFLIGSLVGGIVGAAVGLLMAPKAGKELRDDLNVQVTNAKEKTAKFTDKIRERRVADEVEEEIGPVAIETSENSESAEESEEQVVNEEAAATKEDN